MAVGITSWNYIFIAWVYCLHYSRSYSSFLLLNKDSSVFRNILLANYCHVYQGYKKIFFIPRIWIKWNIYFRVKSTSFSAEDLFIYFSAKMINQNSDRLKRIVSKFCNNLNKSFLKNSQKKIKQKVNGTPTTHLRLGIQ